MRTVLFWKDGSQKQKVMKLIWEEWLWEACKIQKIWWEISALKILRRNLPKAANTVESGTTGGRNRLVKKRTITSWGGEKLAMERWQRTQKSAKRELSKQRRKYNARRYSKKYRRSRANKLSVMTCTVKEKEKQRVTGKSGRREFESTGGGNKPRKDDEGANWGRQEIAREKWRRTRDGQKRVDQTKKKVQSQQNHTTLAEEQTSCLSDTVLKKKETLRVTDKKKKEELERYSRRKYGWGNENEGEERAWEVGRQKEKIKGRRWRESGTKTDNVSDNAKPSFVFLNGVTVGVDGISVRFSNLFRGEPCRRSKKSLKWCISVKTKRT